MANITEVTGQAQKKLCFNVYILGLLLFPTVWLTALYLIKVSLQVSSINFNNNIFWLALLPIIQILIGFIKNRPIMFDWLIFIGVCLPVCALYFLYSVIAGFSYFSANIRLYLLAWMVLAFFVWFYLRSRDVDKPSIKKNMLKYFIDTKKNLYSPAPNKGGVGELYKRSRKDKVINRIKYCIVMLMVYIGPILIGINISSAGNINIKAVATLLFLYLLSLIFGVYIFLLYYTRLKCLYQIQKELGRKLRFY